MTETTPNAPTARERAEGEDEETPIRRAIKELLDAIALHPRGSTMTRHAIDKIVDLHIDALDERGAALLAARREVRALGDALEWIDKEAPLEGLYAGGEGYLAFANRLKARARAALAATQEGK